VYKSLKYFLIIFFISSVIYCQVKKIIKDDITHAEKIIGIEFTDSERDSMLDYLNNRLEDYGKIREVMLDNNIPSALIFNPIPLNFKTQKKQYPIKYHDYFCKELPGNIDDLAYYSIGELASLIKAKKLSSVQLTKFFIDRLKKYSPQLKNVITLTEERAMEEAEQADREISRGKYRGLLHGIPYGVKDLLSTSKYQTTWGSSLYKEQLIDEDAYVIKKLHKAGAVLTAKFSMGALAIGDIWFGGMTRNPWDTTKGSGGSSSGSASAVSAGLIPFAIGTETWGSIVSPATVCGVIGLRPTYGRVSKTGAMTLSWSMDKIGIICHRADDLAIVFNIIYGPDGVDQTVFDIPFNYSSEIDFRKLKIGYLKKDFEQDYEFHKNDSIALKKLEELGAKLIPVELPEISTSSLSIILLAESAAAFDEITRNDKDDLLDGQRKNDRPNRFRSSRFITAVEYINANRIRFMLVQAMQSLMDKVDLYISPSWNGDNLFLTNLTGHPCVVVPNGFSEQGTPTSFTFIGRLFEEGTIISLANKFQIYTEYYKKHPPAF